jgi:diacylglycerol kinase family enzyme
MINNQPALGGNFRMAPMTKNDDGIFNVCIFNHPTRLEFIKALQSCRFRGGPDPNDQHLISFETRAVNIRCTEPSLFYGDLIDEAVEFNVSIVPKALRVYGYRAVRENVDQRTAL